jgi:hypothetical protein
LWGGFTQNGANSNQRSFIVIIKSQKDFFAGLLYVVVGAAFAIGALGYKLGTGARMGPGYFPLLLGVLLGAIGLYIMFKSLVVKTADGDKIGKWGWKPLIFIIAGNLLFGVLLSGLPNLGIPGMGLIVAIYGVTFVVSLAGSGPFILKESLILATILAAISYLGFIKLLNLQFPVWPAFITG